MLKSKMNLCLIVVSIMLFSSTAMAGKYPAFSLAWSEYPSWSVFGVAHKFGLIHGDKGKYGPFEKKWEIDIVLEEAEYDSCLLMYGTGKVDAACITNGDSLQPSLRFKSVVILPTSTSFGADACVVVKNKIPHVNNLVDFVTYGLERYVSQYAFVRCLEVLGKDPSKFKFVNMDPGAAAMVMQQRNPKYNSIVIWNPFLLQTLNKRPDTHKLMTTQLIPGEIIDQVVMLERSLEKPGGDRFASAVADVFYEINKMIADPATKDKTLVAIGEKFSNLNLASMKKVVRQTRFYSKPEYALALFSGGDVFPGGKVATKGNLPEIMNIVVKTAIKIKMADSAPSIGYGTKAEAPNVQLRFDPSYIKMAMSKK